MKPGRGPVLSGLLVVICLLFSPLHAQVGEEFIVANLDRLDALFAQLDPAHADISRITALWESGDRVAAATALCAYYKRKSFPMELLDPPLIPANVVEQAQAAIAGSFFLLNEWEAAPLTATGAIDWQGRGASNDKERAWMLNRHAFILNLAEAARRTGDNRFGSALNDLWQDWIQQSPYPNRLSFSAQWRALEVARRILNSWVYVFYGYTLLDDETRLLVLSSILDHADSLSEHASSWGGNHLITEKMALLMTAVAWPEFRQAGQWRTHSIRDISSEFLSQTYPDGSYKELSNHYQRVVLTNTTKFLKLLETVDRSADDDAVVRRIGEMWDFFAGVMRPDGFGPLNNAADAEHNAAYLEEVWQRFDRPDWLYIATNGREGTPPTEGPSRLFPWAGQAILRSGWERDAAWVYFDAGPYGTAHQHVDRLHVSAALNGRPLLVDNGRYTYRPGPWKDFFQGPDSHNILLLDGQPAEQAPREISRPLDIAFEQTEVAAFAAAKAHFPPAGTLAAHPILPSLTSPTPWTRAVLLDQKGRFVLILDHLLAFQDHRWTALWHFHPGLSAEQAASAISLASPDCAARMNLHLGATKPRIAGFHSPEYNLKQPAAQIEYSGRLNGPTALVWLLRPSGRPVIRATVLSDPADPVQHLLVFENDARIAEFRIQLHPQPRLISGKGD